MPHLFLGVSQDFVKFHTGVSEEVRSTAKDDIVEEGEHREPKALVWAFPQDGVAPQQAVEEFRSLWVRMIHASVHFYFPRLPDECVDLRAKLGELLCDL